jgi:hypothetical protein
MTCDYLGEFTENMEEISASWYIDWIILCGIKKCEFLRFPFERRARDEVLIK